MAPEMKEVSKIFSAIAKAGQSYNFSGVWSEIPCDQGLFLFPPDHAEFLASLRAQFQDETLLKCGVMKNSSAGQLEFHPLLTQQKSPIWAVASTIEGLTVALVCQNRLFGYPGAALAAASQGPAVVSGPESPRGKIIVAYDMVNLALWKSLGFNVILGADWSQLPAARCRELMHALGIVVQVEENEFPDSPSQVDAFEASSPEHRIRYRRSLVLVHGSLAEMTSNDISAATKSWSFLQEINKNFPKSICDCLLWRPSESLLEKVKFLQRIGRAELIAHCLEQSLERDSVAIDPKYAEDTTCVGELERALRTWHSSIEVTRTSEGPRKAFTHLMATYERLMFRPLLEAAANTDDAVEKSLLLSSIDVKRMLTPLVLHASYSISQQIRDSGSKGVNVVTPEQFKQLSMLLDRELKLTKEIQAYRQRKQMPQDPASTASIASKSSPSWAHPRRSCAR